MAWTQCNHCNRFFRDGAHTACPKKPKENPKFEWRRSWHQATAADARIARKFRNVKTMSMF